MALEELIGNPLFTWKIGDSIPYNYSFTHPDYTANQDRWQKCRDAVAGQEAIKSKKTKYLPKLSGQKPHEYENYLNRALYTNYVGRTVQSYEGMIFRKDPLVSFKRKGEDVTSIDKDVYFKKVTTDGKSLNSVLQKAVKEVIEVNRVGVLLDYPSSPEITNPIGMSVKDKEEMGYRPKLSLYPTESIKNWQEITDKGGTIPVMYVLHESVYDYAGGSSIFPTLVDTYRILALEPYVDEEGKLRGKYRQTFLKEGVVMKDGKKTPVFNIEDVIYPKKNGKNLDFIPFYIVTDKGIDPKVLDPSLIYAMAELNISHYQNSADLENELHMVACKTIFFPGWDVKAYGQPRFGGAMAGPDGCVPRIIEASNKSGLADQMLSKVESMAVLGSESISRQGRYVSSASTAKISSKAESSILACLAGAISDAFSEILTFMLEWDDQKGIDVGVILNNDLYEDSITGDELLKWGRSWQSGTLSFDALYNLLEKREVYPENWTKEKESAKIQEGMSAFMDLPEERYAEVSQRITLLSNLLKSTESAGISGLMAQNIPEGVGVVEEETDNKIELVEQDYSDVKEDLPIKE